MYLSVNVLKYKNVVCKIILKYVKYIQTSHIIDTIKKKVQNYLTFK